MSAGQAEQGERIAGQMEISDSGFPNWTPGENRAAVDAPVGQADDDIGEIEAADRPEWLPTNFKSVEAFVEANMHAQRKISAQAEELKQLREEMAQRDLLLQQSMAEIRSVPELAAQSPAAQYADDQALLINAMTAAETARQQIREQAVAAVPGLGEALQAHQNETATYVQQVAEILDRGVPNWQAFGPQIQEAQIRYPDLFADPNPAAVAERIAAVVANTKAERTALEQRGRTGVDQEERAKLLAAQTATGAGTRLDAATDNAAWGEIVKAGANSYADVMRR